jgi:hypothetical protein
MPQLGIYSAWRAADVGEVIAAFHRLHNFYSDAAERRQAIIT